MPGIEAATIVRKDGHTAVLTSAETFAKYAENHPAQPSAVILKREQRSSPRKEHSSLALQHTKTKTHICCVRS